MTKQEIIKARDEELLFYKENKEGQAQIIFDMLQRLESLQQSVKNTILELDTKELIPDDIHNISILRCKQGPNNIINKQYIRQNNSGFQQVNEFIGNQQNLGLNSKKPFLDHHYMVQMWIHLHAFLI